MNKPEIITDRVVLLSIAIGLVAVIFAIVAVIYNATTPHAGLLPNWAENVLVSIATAALLTLKECLSTLIALSSGKQLTTLGTQLGNAAPPPVPLEPDGTQTPTKVVVTNEKDDPVPTQPQQPAAPESQAP